MAAGPGKYGGTLQSALKSVGATSGILMVADGSLGTGFDVQISGEFLPGVVEMLREVADAMERDIAADPRMRAWAEPK